MVTDNDISLSGPLLGSTAIGEGRVQFLRNRLSPTTFPIIGTDGRSRKPTHDLPNVIFQDYNNIPVIFQDNNNTPRAADRSKHTKAVKELAQHLGQVNVDDVESPKYKQCGKCHAAEDLEAVMSWVNGQSANPVDKFKYCSRCKQVTYCSKGCQRAHWRDHRLSCSGNVSS